MQRVEKSDAVALSTAIPYRQSAQRDELIYMDKPTREKPICNKYRSIMLTDRNGRTQWWHYNNNIKRIDNFLLETRPPDKHLAYNNTLTREALRWKQRTRTRTNRAHWPGTQHTYHDVITAHGKYEDRLSAHYRVDSVTPDRRQWED